MDSLMKTLLNSTTINTNYYYFGVPVHSNAENVVLKV
jgi:hypothetical protein